MMWYAEQNIQLWPAEGTSGVSLICVPTSAGFIGDKMKICCTCRQAKSLTEFYKNHDHKDGYQYQCKICYSKYQKEYREKYQKTENGKTVILNASRRYYNKFPERHKAKSSVLYAMRIGKLVRSSILQCHYCPKPAQQYHHHRGYAKKHWLDIVPICIPCHKKIHRKTKRGE